MGCQRSSEFGGDEVFKQDGGAPALAGSLDDRVVEVVDGAAESEAPEVTPQVRPVCWLTASSVSMSWEPGVDVGQFRALGQDEREGRFEPAPPAAGFELWAIEQAPRVWPVLSGAAQGNRMFGHRTSRCGEAACA